LPKGWLSTVRGEHIEEKAMKKRLAAAGLAIAMSETAEAKVNVDVNIGIGGPVYVDPVPIYPGWGYPVYYANRWVSCGHGARIVQRSGFYAVRATDCRGSNYEYIGKSGGRTFWIQMRAANGRIIRVRRL
jgi:hypothetical protein